MEIFHSEKRPNFNITWLKCPGDFLSLQRYISVLGLYKLGIKK